MARTIPRAAQPEGNAKSDSAEGLSQPAPMSRRARRGHSSGMSRNNVPVKVFLADDSDLVRARVAAMLADSGMDVIGQAKSAAESIRGILASRPDAVVLDVQLRDGAGLQVLRAVREVAPSIAFIVFSNESADAYRRRYLAEGARRFLDKTSEFDQLVPALADAARHGS